MSLLLKILRSAIYAAAMIPLLCMASQAPELGMRKTGEAELKWFGISIYTASLWSGSSPFSDEPESGTLMLSIEYHRNVSQSKILKSTKKEWARLGQVDQDKRQAWLGALAGFLPDVGAGDSLSSLVVAGGETRFYLGNTEIGSITDPEFGRAFLAIWLDPTSRYPRQRRKLLSVLTSNFLANVDIGS